MRPPPPKKFFNYLLIRQEYAFIHDYFLMMMMFVENRKKKIREIDFFKFRFHEKSTTILPPQYYPPQPKLLSTFKKEKFN